MPQREGFASAPLSVVQREIVAGEANSRPKRVLVTWGSKRGGTEGVARLLADALEEHGVQVVRSAVQDLPRDVLDRVDAVVVGGALYGNRWPTAVTRWVGRNLGRLRERPVWFFSSGPLDDRAKRSEIAPPPEVAVQAERVGAKEHVTFGGRLEPDAQGFPASAMAREHAGDWRDPERVRRWAAQLAEQLPDATPGEHTDHEARSIHRLLAHAGVGWMIHASILGLLLAAVSTPAALLVRLIAAPLVFAAVAWHYFAARGARSALPTAAVFTSVVVLLDLLVVAGIVQRSLAMFASITGTWLAFALIFVATWATGTSMSMLASPPPESRRQSVPH